jgi:hypothetical protein
VGGWGENTKHTSRIKERRIVLCVDNATLPVVGGGKAGAGKIKFRKVNNGAGELREWERLSPVVLGWIGD